jgi:hypothetical protein
MANLAMLDIENSVRGIALREHWLPVGIFHYRMTASDPG